MRDHLSWSISLGRWGGLNVRLHMFFLMFAVLTMYICVVSSTGDNGTGGNGIWIGIAVIGLLLLGVLLHDLAHVYVLKRFGGTTDRIVLGPFGGMAPVGNSLSPREDFLVACAGPFANLSLAVLCTIVLVLLRGSDFSFSILHPLRPELLSADVPSTALQFCLWINWSLALLNLIPAYPFDGARIMRAAIRSLRPQVTSRQAVFLTFIAGRVIAVLLLALAWYVGLHPTTQVIPAAYGLALLGILVFFSAARDEHVEDDVERDERPFGYDFSQGYTSLNRSIAEPAPRLGVLQQWLRKRQEVRHRRRVQLEEQEEQRVDEILRRLHEEGMESLSPDDRYLLNRVSARYRNRR